MFVDSHCHLDQLKFDEIEEVTDPTSALAEAKKVGVEYVLTIGCNRNEYSPLLELCRKHPQTVSMTIGIHPCEPKEDSPTFDELYDLASVPEVVAIGETGLDYFRDKEDVDWQHDRFRTHIQVAKKLSKPLIIHTREAQADTIRILKEEKAEECKGVMHCFTEDWAMAQQALALGFYISFSGIVTFKNAKQIQEVAQKVPLDRMLIETDSPYLAPVPKRGKSNYPHNVPLVAEYIANLRGTSVEEIATHTTSNFYRLFKLNK